VIFISSHYVVSSYAIVTIKYATVETIRSVGAFFVAISTCYWAVSAFFYCQHINQAIEIKTGRKMRGGSGLFPIDRLLGMCRWLGSHFEIGLIRMGLHLKGVYASMGSHCTFSIRL